VIPLRDINPTRNQPVVVYVLLALNVLVFLYEVTLPPAQAELFQLRWALIPAMLTERHEIHSLSTPLTSMFMHGDVLHLGFNMWTLHIFGDNVEDKMGRTRFVIFYLLCGLAAAAAQTLVDPSSRVPMIGASGAIAGVLSAYMKLFPGARVVTLIPIFFFFFVRELPAVFFIALWFVLQVLYGLGSLGQIGTGQGGVAFFAHIGGFLAGLALWRQLLPPRGRDRGRVHRLH